MTTGKLPGTQPVEVHLGRNVQKIRELRNMKQAGLAHAAGMQQQYVSRLERRMHIADTVLIKLAHALEVSAEFIRNYDPDNPFSENNILHGMKLGPEVPYFEELVSLLKQFRSLLNQEKAKLASLNEVDATLTRLEKSINYQRAFINSKK